MSISFPEKDETLPALSAEHPSNILVMAHVTLDRNTRRVTCAGEELSLTDKEYAVLEYLMYNKNVVMSREDIGQHIWNFHYDHTSNVIDVYIRGLRKKLDAPGRKKLIRTIRGGGYMMKEDS